MRRFLIFLVVLIICLPVFASPTKPYPDLSDGDALTSTWLIGTFNVLYDWADGNITNANIASSAAISGEKLAAGTVPEVSLSATYTASLTAFITSGDSAVSASASSDLAAHVASGTNPHGTTLNQDVLNASTANILNLNATTANILTLNATTANILTLNATHSQEYDLEVSDIATISRLAVLDRVDLGGPASFTASTTFDCDVDFNRSVVFNYFATFTDTVWFNSSVSFSSAGTTSIANLVATLYSALDCNDKKLTGLATGTSATDAVNYGQVSADNSTTLASLAAHIADGTDPHGSTLTQTNLTATTLSGVDVTVTNLAATLSTDLDAGDNKITNLATGTDATDAVNYGQLVDAVDGTTSESFVTSQAEMAVASFSAYESQLDEAGGSTFGYTDIGTATTSGVSRAYIYSLGLGQKAYGCSSEAVLVTCTGALEIETTGIETQEYSVDVFLVASEAWNSPITSNYVCSQRCSGYLVNTDGTTFRQTVPFTLTAPIIQPSKESGKSCATMWLGYTIRTSTGINYMHLNRFGDGFSSMSLGGIVDP